MHAGENGFLEDYVAEVRGKPIGCVVLVSRNAAGQTEHVVASYRSRSSVVFFAHLLAEEFAGTTIGDHFADQSREMDSTVTRLSRKRVRLRHVRNATLLLHRARQTGFLYGAFSGSSA